MLDNVSDRLNKVAAWTGILYLPLLYLSPVFAQKLPDGNTLMNWADNAMRNRHSIHLVLDRSIEFTAGDQRKKINTTVTLWFVSPGNLRIEQNFPEGSTLLVSDQKSTWFYDLKQKRYLNIPAATGLTQLLVSLGVPGLPGAASISMISKTVGQETVTVAGQRHDCWIVQSSSDEFSTEGSGLIFHPIWTVWLDKVLGLDVKATLSGELELAGMMTHVEVRAVKRILRMDEPTPEARFAFVPKGGARELREDKSLRDGFFFASHLDGNRAPQFKFLARPQGGGKPVLLVFATTWCRPCLQSMPTLEKLYGDYRQRGLMVFQIHIGEDRATLDRLLKTSPVSYPILTRDTENGLLFVVSGYPTFVMIGKDGKILGNQTGFSTETSGDEEYLRALVERAFFEARPD
jgi:thiol-disulfide isomerase/thioredoxin